jgi:hypothetical protein
LLGRLRRIAVETVLTFYAARAGEEGGPGAKSGGVTAVREGWGTLFSGGGNTLQGQRTFRA